MMTVTTTSQSLLRPISGPQRAFRSHSRAPARSRIVRVCAEVKRSFNEEDGKITSGDGKGPVRADSDPPPSLQKSMSTEQQKKLRDEYLGFGGSPNKPIPNYFLYAIVGISVLAVLSWLSGAV